MSMAQFIEMLLGPLTNEFFKLPAETQKTILSKYRLQRIEFAIACELEELQLLASDIDEAVCARRLLPSAQLKAGAREITFPQKLRMWVSASLHTLRGV